VLTGRYLTQVSPPQVMYLHSPSAVVTVSSGFRVIPGGKESSEFWREGRVFMLLCSQPAGGKPEREGTRDYSHMKIRRFVIIRDNHGHCLCL
jgi:hypothetical protein